LSSPSRRPQRRLVTILLSSFLPGALAGTQLAGLLFFLNPHLPFDFLPVLRGVTTYGALFGTVSTLLLFPVYWRWPAKARRWLPSILTLVLAISASVAWVHAFHFSFFLPPGINRRLLKAAIWITLAAVVCFYTVLVHRVRHRPYGRRSQGLFLLMAIISVSVAMERREAFHPYTPPAPRPTVFEGSTRPKLCIVAIESATLDAILLLEEQGRLPFFSTLLQQGAHGRMVTIQPDRRAALWTTLSTGKLPYRHGIVGDDLYDAGHIAPQATFSILPLGMAFEVWGTKGWLRSVDRLSPHVRPFWEILGLLEVPTALIGWPLTSPPDDRVPINLSDRFFEEAEDSMAYPQELVERARLFRIASPEIDPTLISRFGQQPSDTVLNALAKDIWRRDLGSFLLDQSPQSDAFLLLLPGLKQISAAYFGGFSAVHFEGVQDAEALEAALIISAYYTFLDDLLQRYWDMLPEPKLMVVVSTHGVSGPSGWQELSRRLTRQPILKVSFDDGADGVLMLMGEGVRQDHALRPSQLVDLMPTLLYGMGLPIARDLDGVVLTDAFDQSFLARQPLTFVPSYEALTVPE
jgi:predicted AlkP superfamily phosphohydrolase/phosphomutase